MKQHFKYQKKILFLLSLVPACAILFFLHFGGFSTGSSADPNEFAKYAQSVEEITVPPTAKIIALGEATHGNAEFQSLKLDVFRQLVEDYGVKAFAIEGDFGGCEQVNRYIHNGSGSAEQAAKAIVFSIYQTQEITQLISYMRSYNETAAPGEDIRFYGFDMQRISNTLSLLIEDCQKLGVDPSPLQNLACGEDWNSDLDSDALIARITQIREKLKTKHAPEQTVHYTDMLLQLCQLQSLPTSQGGELRDRFLAENVQWILKQEQTRGQQRIFLSGHNCHVAKWGSYDSMGKLLSLQEENGYYAIGTDFYKTRCNLPTHSGKRITQTFYSHDPLAKAANRADIDLCWLDFSKVPKSSPLFSQISDYTYLGNLGEGYSFLMRLLPQSYRIFQPPATLYDSMIFVSDASPTTILK